MSMAPPNSSVPDTLAFRQRFGAALMLLAMALLTVLFWVGVVRLFLDA